MTPVMGGMQIFNAGSGTYS